MSNLLQIQEGKRINDSNVSAGALVCVFHGYGANRENLYDVAVTLSKDMPSVRFIIPNGIQRFEDYPLGDGYQWFSLREFTQQYMQRGIATVAPKIAAWIKQRLDELNLTEDKLYLTGFSQGGMIALHLAASGLVAPNKVLSYSGMFVPPIQNNRTPKNTVVLAVHGDSDKVVPLEMAKTSYNLLKDHGLQNLQFMVEKGVEHYITPKGLAAGVNFLRN